MKIFYITDIDFSLEGAPSIHVKEEIENLSNLGNEVLLLGMRNGKIPNKIQVKYIPVPKIKFLRSMLFNLNLFFILLFYVKRRKVQIIYTRQGEFLISPAIISKLFSIPYITELNGTIEEEMKIDKNPKILIKLATSIEKFCYKESSKIMVVTSSMKEYLINKYKLNSSKINVLENGVNTDIFKPEKLKQKYDLIFVGNLALWQGLDYLIQAISRVKIKNENIKIAILGDGQEKGNLLKLIKESKLENNFLFLGSKSHEDIPKFLNRSNVCVAPFALSDRNKKTGISAFKIYEYASCEKPIITTNLEGVSEFVNNNKCGIIVEPNNSKAFANAIIKLLDNPKLGKEMGRNGRKAILHGYSWRNVAERVQKVMKDVVKEHSS
jgi:glycosyltransferase involved in cell wall biosynthesis